MTAALPRRVMNSRRFMAPPTPEGHEYSTLHCGGQDGASFRKLNILPVNYASSGR
jgi:hypothetical protein